MSTGNILAAFESAFPSLYSLTEPVTADLETSGIAHVNSSDSAVTEQHLVSQNADDLYTHKIQRITQKFQSTRQSADDLEQYLKAQEKEAKLAEAKALARADEEFTPAWRITGLPMKPSHLQLDQGRMSGAKLVDPKAILGQYQKLKSKEVLKPPHIYEYNDKAISPHYTKTTTNLTARQASLPEETLKRAKELSLKTRTWNMLSEQEVAQRIAESEERRMLQDLKMPAAQFDLEKKIIESMHHKLSFLRNPRYVLPPAVKQLQTQFKPGHRWNVPEVERPKPPIKANMTARPDVIFVVEPGEVCFTDYEVGAVYTQRVKIRNVTSVIRTLRVFPPASQYFHMSLPRFPVEDGAVAPGMHAEVTLRFCPDSLADYDDAFAVDMAESRLTVRVMARRPPPSLTLARELMVGDVLMGNRKVVQFNFCNQGGPGRFRIIPEALWPNHAGNAPMDMARLGPFQVWPLYLDLVSGEEATINVCFEPKETGTFSQRLVMVCDNCQVKDFIISGVSCSVDVVLESVDGVTATPGLLDLPLWFGEVVPGSGFTKHLSVRNTTTLPFPFAWRQGQYPQTMSVVPPNALLLGIEKEGLTSSGQLPTPEGGVDSTLGPLKGSGAYGRIDAVALGLTGEKSAFVVQPSEGVLRPGEVLDVSIIFLPMDSTKRYQSWLQLMVDKTAIDQAPQGCNVTVLEIGLEGLGAALELDVAPRFISLPGALTPGAVVSRSIILRNPSRAPAHYDISHLPASVPTSYFSQRPTSSNQMFNLSINHSSSMAAYTPQTPVLGPLTVTPAKGVVLPLSETEVTVTFSALDDSLVGEHLHRLICNVKHGTPVAIDVQSKVVLPAVELLTTSLDYGLVRLKDSSTLPVIIHNTSDTADATWSLSEHCMDGDMREIEQRRTGTYIEFVPNEGVMLPGEKVIVKATLRAEADGQYRSIVNLKGPGGADGLTGYIETFAAVVMPRAVLSTPFIDLGATFVGVTVKASVSITNLSLLPLDYKFTVDCPNDDPLAELKMKPDKGVLEPGQSQEVQLRYTPRAIGQSIVLCVCDLEGAPEPTGFMLTSVVRGLEATFDLFTPREIEDYKELLEAQETGRMLRSIDDVDNFKGMSNLPPDILSRLESHQHASVANRHLVANFGEAVPLGEAQHLYLLITNRTPSHCTVKTWLDSFGVEDASKLTYKDRTSVEKPGDPGIKPVKGSKYKPIKLSDTAETTTPFRSSRGNGMIATRMLQLKSEEVLGNKGLAVSVTPPESTIGPWGRLVLQVTCFNDMCGDYFDMLHVKVGDLPSKDVPVRVGVAGTPLVVQKERVLVKGLRGKVWRTNVDYGELPVGIPLEKTFYVFNTGGLDMLLDWEMLRYQDETDCQRPESKILDIKLEVTTPRPISEEVHEEVPGWVVIQDEASSIAIPDGQAAAIDEGTDGSALVDAQQPHSTNPEEALEGADEERSGNSFDEEQKEGLEVMAEPEPRVVLSYETHAEADVAPFVVEPASKIIKGGDFAKFTVRFKSERAARHAGYLIGRQQVHAPPQPISLKIWPEGEQAESVGTLFTGTFHPYAGNPPTPLQPLRVDLSATVISSRLEPDERSDLTFTCLSTNPASIHASYRRVLTMSNLQTCPLLFKMQTEGPFKLLEVTPSAPQDPVSYQGIVGTPVSFGEGTYLPPKESVDVSIHFLPNNSNPQQGSATTLTPLASTSYNGSGRMQRVSHLGTNGGGGNPSDTHAHAQYISGKDNTAAQDFTLRGSLVVTYANGDVQRLPLEGTVLHPALDLRQPVTGLPMIQGSSDGIIAFGRVHVSAPKPVEVLLSNPTLVDAKWFVTTPGVRPSTANSVVGGEAAEVRMGPFLVRPASGLLPGRGLRLPRTQRVTITYAPTSAVDAAQTLVFSAVKGRACTLSLTGTGSLDETEEHQAPLKYKI